jgi:flagellar basal body rod protein FlgB
MEQQIAELSKNQMQHNLAVNLLASQFRLLQAAISERV